MLRALQRRLRALPRASPREAGPSARGPLMAARAAGVALAGAGGFACALASCEPAPAPDRFPALALGARARAIAASPAPLAEAAPEAAPEAEAATPRDVAAELALAREQLAARRLAVASFLGGESAALRAELEADVLAGLDDLRAPALLGKLEQLRATKDASAARELEKEAPCVRAPPTRRSVAALIASAACLAHCA